MFRVKGLGFRVLCLGFRVEGLETQECRVEGLGRRAYCLGFREYYSRDFKY